MSSPFEIYKMKENCLKLQHEIELKKLEVDYNIYQRTGFLENGSNYDDCLSSHNLHIEKKLCFITFSHAVFTGL